MPQDVFQPHLISLLQANLVFSFANSSLFPLIHIYPQVIPMKSLQLSEIFQTWQKRSCTFMSYEFYSLPFPKRLASYGNFPKYTRWLHFISIVERPVFLSQQLPSCAGDIICSQRLCRITFLPIWSEKCCSSCKPCFISLYSQREHEYKKKILSENVHWKRTGVSWHFDAVNVVIAQPIWGRRQRVGE